MKHYHHRQRGPALTEVMECSWLCHYKWMWLSRTYASQNVPLLILKTHEHHFYHVHVLKCRSCRQFLFLIQAFCLTLRPILQLDWNSKIDRAVWKGIYSYLSSWIHSLWASYIFILSLLLSVCVCVCLFFDVLQYRSLRGEGAHKNLKFMFIKHKWRRNYELMIHNCCSHEMSEMETVHHMWGIFKLLGKSLQIDTRALLETLVRLFLHLVLHVLL